MSKFRQIKRNLQRKADAELEAKRTQERLEREKQHREKLAAMPKEDEGTTSINAVGNQNNRSRIGLSLVVAAMAGLSLASHSGIKSKI